MAPATKKLKHQNIYTSEVFVQADRNSKTLPFPKTDLFLLD